MKTKIIFTVVGARPQFIKASALSRVILKSSALDEVIIHTGQHYDDNMSAVFFDELGIPKPQYNLGVAGGTHGQMTAEMLTKLEEVMLIERPDVVLVYGDTNSTLAAALAAAKLNIPIAHVEAGLRSFNRAMPEETNRVLTDHCSDLLFTPTSAATNQLIKEGISGDRIIEVGDIMLDVALHTRSSLSSLSAPLPLLAKLQVNDRPFVLSTIHRQENTDDQNRLRAIFEGLNALSEHYPVVLPLHPRTKKRLTEHGLDHLLETLKLTAPLGYREMVALESSAALIVTDSGGVQKEAFFHHTPCLTLRDETEWIELIEGGWNRLLTPSDPQDICETALNTLGLVGEAIQPYGQGDAAEKISAGLISYFQMTSRVDAD